MSECVKKAKANFETVSKTSTKYFNCENYETKTLTAEVHLQRDMIIAFPSRCDSLNNINRGLAIICENY